MLDLIGDIGGLAEGLIIILGSVISIITFKKFDHFMIEFLFGKHEKDTSESDETTNISKLIVPLSDKNTSMCRQKCH